MLATGIRTPVIKVYGPDLAELERLARLIEAAVRAVPEQRALSPNALLAATISISTRIARSSRVMV